MSLASTSMTVNSSNRRLKTKKQLDNTNRRINALKIDEDMCRLMWNTQTGTSQGNGGVAINLNYPILYGGLGYTNLFTDPSGNFPATATRLAPNTGTLWEIGADKKNVQYNGEAKSCHYYASMTLSQTDDNKAVIGTSAFDGGSGAYTVATTPLVVVDNSGTGGSGFAAITILNSAGAATGIQITNPGHSYNTAPTVSFTTPNGGVIGDMSATIVISESGLNLAIFKKSVGDADFSILDPSTVAESVCSQDNTTSSVIKLSFIAPITAGDIIETRLQTNATEVLGYKLYSNVLSLRPIFLQGHDSTTTY